MKQPVQKIAYATAGNEDQRYIVTDGIFFGIKKVSKTAKKKKGYTDIKEKKSDILWEAIHYSQETTVVFDKRYFEKIVQKGYFISGWRIFYSKKLRVLVGGNGDSKQCYRAKNTSLSTALF